jgi:hypothetical protein
VGLAEFLDGLDKMFPGYGFFADLLRGGLSRVDQDRLGDDGQLHRLARGDATGTVSVFVNGRDAHFDRPDGWEELSPDDLAALRAAAGPQHFAQLYRPDSNPDDVYSITFLSGVDAGLARMKPVRWALWSEGHLGLPVDGRIRRVLFGDAVGYLWHHEGVVEGWKLGRTQQHAIPVHIGEMWSATSQGLVRVALAAPPSETENAVAGFKTVIASWAWD